MRWLVILLLLALTACNAGRQGARQPGAQLSPWLDPGAQIGAAARLVTREGVDIRQAVYFDSPQGLEILALTRDYSQRQAGVSDPQTLSLLPAGPGAQAEVALGAEYLPLELLAAPGRQAWSLTAVRRGEGVRLEQAALELLVPGGGRFVTYELRDGFCPVGYISSHQLYCRAVSARRREGGLVLLDYDFTKPGMIFDTNGGRMLKARSPAFCAAGPGRELGGFILDFNPALPASARISYGIYSRSGSLEHSFEFPYFVSYGSEQWDPPLAFAGRGTLVTLAFRPDAEGRGGQPNSRGIFRLVSLSAAGGTRILEDHVSPYTSFAAAEGVIFYTLRVFSPEGERWELWAASPDGLSKQRLLTDDSVVYISVEDVFSAQRVLIQRLFYAGGNELRSELRELSLGPLQPSDGVEIPAPASPPAAAPLRRESSRRSSAPGAAGPAQGGSAAEGGMEEGPPPEGGEGVAPPIAIP